jgi:ribosomal protein S18 acetylase RimI-like enzyme
MNPSIRSAVASDIPLVLELWFAADAEPSHTDNAESLTKLVAHDPDALLVAHDNELLVGTVIAAWDGWRGSIYRLAVVPSHRSQGLGRRLLAAAEERLDRAGAQRLQAIVVETSPIARAFWSAVGWEQQVERLRFVCG